MFFHLLEQPNISMKDCIKGESQFSVLPLPLSFARSRESKGCPNSGFDRGVGLRGRGRYPLKPRIFASLLETNGTQNTLRPDHPESIFGLNNLFKITTVLFCALHSPVTYIYICNHVLNWNVFEKNRYFSTLMLHCCFAQQSRISLNRENITKTHAIDKHTLADGKFVINSCRLWWRSSQLAMMYDDVTVTKWRLIS